MSTHPFSGQVKAVGLGDECVGHQEQHVRVARILFAVHCWVFALGQASRGPPAWSRLGSPFSCYYL